MSKIEKKKRFVLVGLLALILAFGIINSKLNNEQDLNTSAGYPEHEEQEMMLHDGDVLVDSLNITAVPGNSPNVDKKTPAGAKTSGSSVVTSDDVTENADSYFEEFRATVNMDRNMVLSMLTDVIKEAESTAEKDNATKQKLKIIDYMDKEKVIESLIETKGLPTSLVLITDNSVNVTVNKQELTKSDVAKISDIIMRETGRPASQIVIQSKY